MLIADQSRIELNDPNVAFFRGERYFDVLGESDLLLKSPGVPLKNATLPMGLEVTCQADLFLRFAPCLKVGVTGTKGKTTTSTLIHEMLRASGIGSRLMGNMGVPVFDCLEGLEQAAVIELSSHQLEYCRASPQVAVWTNLYEEHLDHYTGGFLGYAAAKANICRWQEPNDVLIYNAEQPLLELANVTECRARLLPIGATEEPPFLRGITNPRLCGEHNRQDIYFAAAAARQLGATEEAICQAVLEFQGIPHRMYPISDAGRIHWVDDCISTIPRSVLCAIDALGDVDTLLIGGQDRGLCYDAFAQELACRSVRHIICMPETGQSIARLLRQQGSGQKILEVQTMEEAVAAAQLYTAAGKTCLLSPAAASYNQYKNFEEKGRHFAECINNIAAAKPLSPE